MKPRTHFEKIYSQNICIKKSKFDIFQFFLNLTFFQKWSAQKHSATKMSLNIASVYLQENWTKSTQGIHFKKPKFHIFWHFSTFLNIIFYYINYNYESIKQLKCPKNVSICLNLINIKLVIENCCGKNRQQK